MRRSCLKDLVSAARLAAAISLSVAGLLHAQARPYTLGEVVGLLGQGVRPTRVLDKVRTSCVDFDPGEPMTARTLRAAGADDNLIRQLAAICRPRPAAQREPVTRPTPSRRPDTVIVVRHDTVRTSGPVRTVTHIDTVYVPRPEPRSSSATPTTERAGNRPVAPSDNGACEIDEGAPSPVARAVLDIQLARQSTVPADAAAKLRAAVHLVSSEGDPFTNREGRAFTLGRALVLLADNPTVDTRRLTAADVGLAGSGSRFNIISAIDSAFSVVEDRHPSCAAQTAPWRQQRLWVDLVNRAIAFANSDNLDSAAYYANQSLILSRTSSYAYGILGQVAARRNDPRDAIANYREAVRLSADSVDNDIHRQWLYQLGSYAADQAEANPANKAVYLGDAQDAFAALARDPGPKFADAARTGLARVAGLTGDSRAVQATYADILRDPAAFSYTSLMSAAVTAAKSEQNADATRLFEAALGKNPFHRDVLYNLTRLYLLGSDYARAIPLGRRLLAVDPNSADAYQLMAIGFASLQKAYTAKRSVSQAYADSSARAVDSALKYNTLRENLAAAMTFTEFTPGDSKTTLGGQITNNTNTARAFRTRVQFLDARGNVISEQTIQTGVVAPHQSQSFAIDGVGAGIIAFRYTPLS